MTKLDVKPKPANPPKEEPKQCKPYPVGMMGYIGPEVHKTGVDAGKSHYHIYTVNQNRNTCQCFWNNANKKIYGHQYFGKIEVGWINLNGSTKRPPNYPH